MNFEGFKDLIQRVAVQWYALAKKEILDMDAVDKYLAVNPFSASQTTDNEEAYERLMDCRCKLLVSIYYSNVRGAEREWVYNFANASIW
jgi:hypothetical protein